MHEGQSAITTIENNKNYMIPINHLQRAITSNLPCFTINFQASDRIPAATIVVEELYEHFRNTMLKLNANFSTVRYIGNQLKIGVNN